MTGADLLILLKKHPLGFASALVAVVCLGLYFLRESVVDEYVQLGEQKSAESAKILNNVRNSANLAEQLVEMQEITKEIGSRLIRPNQIALNLQFFYRLETETGVKLNDVRQGTNPPGRAGQAGAYIGVPFTVSVQGTHRQVMNFLRRLEAGSNFARFNTVSFGKVNTNEAVAPGAGLISLSMNLDLLGQP